MKTIILFFGLLLTTSLVAQDRVSYQQPLEYSSTGTIVLREIQHYPGKSKEELYKTGEEWFARKFAGDLLPFDGYSQSQNKLIGRGFFSYETFPAINTDLADITYVLTMSFKDGKIKIEAEEILIFGQTSIVSVTEEFLQPKPAREVIGDEALYKRNGKPRKVKKRHKESILRYCYGQLDYINTFFNSTTEDEDW